MRRSAVEKGAFSDEDLSRFREAMSRPGALTAALNYYRAARAGSFPGDLMVQAPTLVLWGVHDVALGLPLTQGMERWVPDMRLQYLDCGHWTQQERFTEVNRYLLEFL
jgi:pimeloyl-ACP methyl ester carboxylesterase